MENILKDHAILPSLLTSGQTALFNQAIDDAKACNGAPFEDFIKSVNARADKLKNRLDYVYKNAQMLAKRALSALEMASSRPESYVFSAFSQSIDAGELEAIHIRLVSSVWEILSELELLIETCAISIDECDDALVSEYKLRLAALCEFPKDGLPLDGYKGLEDTVNKISRLSVTESFLGAEKPVEALSEVLKRLCTDTDTAFEAIINRTESQSAYNRIILQYADVVNAILNTLHEQGEQK